MIYTGSRRDGSKEAEGQHPSSLTYINLTACPLRASQDISIETNTIYREYNNMSIYKHALTGALMVSTTLAARLEMWSCYSEHDVQHDANFETTLESGLIQGESAQNDNPTSYPCQTFAAEAMFGQIDLPAEDGSQTKFTSKLLWGNETKRVIPVSAGQRNARDRIKTLIICQ